jgi:hypothetical protein
MVGLVASAGAQIPEPDLPRPGSIAVSAVVGDAAMVVPEQRRTLKTDDRLRVGSTVVTGRRSMAVLAFSNGASVELGADSELELEEFGQAPVAGTLKLAELQAEPTVSRTRLRLVRGGVTVTVKPLKAARGSSFTLTLQAGVVRTTAGSFRASVQMSDLGLGVCNLELLDGAAEFEAAGTSAAAPLPAGKKQVFALEIDKGTGAVKVGEMPPAATKKK